MCCDAHLYSRCCLLGYSISCIQVIHLHCTASCQALAWARQLDLSEAPVMSLSSFQNCKLRHQAHLLAGYSSC